MEEKETQILDATNPIEEVVETTIEMDEELSLKELADSLREEIAALEDQEKKLAEKLCEVKRKGLPESAAKCRDLLQRMVRERMAKQADLKDVEESYREAKAKRELAETTAEVDALTEQIEKDFFEADLDLLEKPTLEPAYDHFARAKRLSVIAKSTALIGILAGLLGLVVYLLLAAEDVVTFSWISFVVFGVVAIGTTVAGLLIGRAANKHKQIGETLKLEIETKMAEYEAELLERERLKAEMDAPWHLENLDAATEVQRMERENDVAFAAAEEKRARRNRAILRGVDTVEFAKKNKEKLATVALAGSAVLAAVALSKAQKKKVRAARSAAIRKEIRGWLDI